MPVRRCGDFGGITAMGSPCQIALAAGHTKCPMHGGLATASVMKARQQLALIAAPAIETLFSFIDQYSRDTCPGCGFPKHDAEEKRLVAQIAFKVLDRTGFGPSATLNITTQTDGDLNLELLTPEEHRELKAAAMTMIKIKAALRQRQLLGAQGLPDIDVEPVAIESGAAAPKE